MILDTCKTCEATSHNIITGIWGNCDQSPIVTTRIRILRSTKPGMNDYSLFWFLLFANFYLNSMLQAVELPAGIAHLDSRLANVNGKALSHIGAFELKLLQQQQGMLFLRETIDQVQQVNVGRLWTRAGWSRNYLILARSGQEGDDHVMESTSCYSAIRRSDSTQNLWAAASGAVQEDYVCVYINCRDQAACSEACVKDIFQRQGCRWD